MTRRGVLLVVLLAAFALPLRSAALSDAVASDTSTWTSIGPPGSASPVSVAFDPEQPKVAVAALEGNGMVRSVDGGETWQPANAGLTVPVAGGVVIHPRLSSLVYAVNIFNQLVRSTDGGVSWSEIVVGSSLNNILLIAPVPADPHLIYAGTGNTILLSRDQGSTWRPIGGRGLPTHFHIVSLAVDAVNPRLLYTSVAAPSHFGVWVSSDGGSSWQRRLRDVPDSVFTDPARSGFVYLIANGFVQRSRDQGATWEPYFGGGGAESVEFDPRNPRVAYLTSDRLPPSQILKTTDDGGHWSTLEDNLSPGVFLSVLAVAAGGERILFGGLPPAFLLSTDGGSTFVPTGREIVNSNIAALGFGAQGALFAATNRGLSRTLDGGVTWTQVLKVQVGVNVITSDPQQPSTLYAGALLGSGAVPPVVWKSTDNGDTWTALPYPQPVASPYSGLQVMDLAVNPTDSNVVYLAAETALVGATEDGGGLYRSGDGGQTWQRAALPLIDFWSVVVSPDQPGEVWALATENVYKSVDSGQTWESVLFSPIGRPLRSVRLAPSNSSEVWAVGDYDLYRSHDGGATWAHLAGLIQPPGFPFQEVGQPLAIDPRNGDTVYLAWLAGVSRRSLGTRWQPFDAGLLNRQAQCIAFDPNDPSRLFVGTEYGGVDVITVPSP